MAQPYRFVDFVCEVEHPSEAVEVRILCFTLASFLLGFSPLAARLKKNCIVRLLTGDASKRTTNVPFPS